MTWETMRGAVHILSPDRKTSSCSSACCMKASTSRGKLPTQTFPSYTCKYYYYYDIIIYIMYNIYIILFVLLSYYIFIIFIIIRCNYFYCVEMRWNRRDICSKCSMRHDVLYLKSKKRKHNLHNSWPQLRAQVFLKMRKTLERWGNFSHNKNSISGGGGNKSDLFGCILKKMRGVYRLKIVYSFIIVYLFYVLFIVYCLLK